MPLFFLMYLTATIDVKNDTVSVEGNIDELGDLAISKDNYIDMFKHQAKLFIEYNVSDPDKYFDD